MALTKADIVEAVQTQVGFTRHQSVSIVENLLEGTHTLSPACYHNFSEALNTVDVLEVVQV